MKLEVSNAEILDKASILMIKMKFIKDKQKLQNIQKEYVCLRPAVLAILSKSKSNEIELLYERLCDVNESLWEIEDQIREKERQKAFDEEFIELARSVYYTNDKRSEIKKQINLATESNFVEEKSYETY
jgi:TRAP-type mannitol/chloroaromatic compound transport system substrate-binding protein